MERHDGGGGGGSWPERVSSGSSWSRAGGAASYVKACRTTAEGEIRGGDGAAGDVGGGRGRRLMFTAVVQQQRKGGKAAADLGRNGGASGLAVRREAGQTASPAQGMVHSLWLCSV